MVTRIGALIIPETTTKYGAGHCDKCGSNNISLSKPTAQSYMVIYTYTCRNCQHEGEEGYTLTYCDSR